MNDFHFVLLLDHGWHMWYLDPIDFVKLSESSSTCSSWQYICSDLSHRHPHKIDIYHFSKAFDFWQGKSGMAIMTWLHLTRRSWYIRLSYWRIKVHNKNLCLRLIKSMLLVRERNLNILWNISAGCSILKANKGRSTLTKPTLVNRSFTNTSMLTPINNYTVSEDNSMLRWYALTVFA
jgi:hypothetical protein